VGILEAPAPAWAGRLHFHDRLGLRMISPHVRCCITIFASWLQQKFRNFSYR
jgi:hypothetical protein